MKQDDFDSFIRKLKDSDSQKDHSNIKKKLEQWISNVNTLYLNVEEWLHPYIRNESIVLEKESIKITEELLGSYNINMLHIYIVNRRVTLKPIGANLIGNVSRVDMKSGVLTYSFVIIPKNIKRQSYRKTVLDRTENRDNKPVWKLYTRTPFEIIYEDLSQKLFLDCLMSIING